MNLGYSRALGLACTHCHVEQDFSRDDKRPKRAARDMANLHKTINDQLQKMENLDLINRLSWRRLGQIAESYELQ